MFSALPARTQHTNKPISRDGAAAEEEESPLAVGNKRARERRAGNVVGRAKVRRRTVRRGAPSSAAVGLR